MITDMTNTNDNWIYQSNKLIEASYSFTVLEQKLVRLLASMIRKDDKDFKEYQFKAVDLSELLKINQKNIYMELDKMTDKLMTRYIKIKHTDSEKFKKRHLIKIADFENGLLTMKIDEDMKDFYLKLNWYTKYQLKNIMQFKSTYSFRLYELFKQYENIGHRSIGIDELRSILEIGKTQYAKYSNLKQKVISVGLNEINKNTDLHIDYEEMKDGRKVKTIKFHIRSNTKAKNEIVATKVDEINDDPKGLKENEYIEKVKIIMCDHDITSLEASKIYESSKGDYEIIDTVYKNFKNKQVGNFVGSMISMVKLGVFQNPKGNNKKTNFNDYEQRSYDYDDLEKKLLGWK
jgi:plasmid replication initiation protein